MSKHKNQEKKARRLNELQELAQGNALNLVQYSSSHFRLFGGPTVVDYWPGSGKCWVTGSESQGTVIEPPEVIRWALTQPVPEGAREHLAEISQVGQSPKEKLPTARDFSEALPKDHKAEFARLMSIGHNGHKAWCRINHVGDYCNCEERAHP